MTEELFAKLKHSKRLPSPPGVAWRILELSRSDDACLDNMTQAIGSDPALAGRILKFVNSPTAGIGRRISTLDEAVNQLGLRGVTLMALSFSLISAGRVEVCPSFDLERAWSRSLACAVAARRLATLAGRMDPNEAFIMGLLLHIGQLALASGWPDAYEQVLAAAAGRQHKLLAIEKDRLGASHLEAGAHLLADWRLPECIWQTILQVQNPPPPRDAAGHIQPAHLIHMADITARLLCDLKEQRKGDIETILLLAGETLEMDEKAWMDFYQQVSADWRAYGQVLSIKAGTDKSFQDLQDDAREQIATLTLATQLESLGIKKQNQELLERSRVDSLTGVGNRAAFDERLAGELERAKRTQRPLVLCLLDVDYFKRFNDAHGHLAGDAALQVVARTLDDTVRKMDFVARYGGEEFAVIAPECNPPSAASLAERLCAAVKEAVVELHHSRFKVTISVGVAFAHWPHHARTPGELIQAADTHLYEAKKGGRDRCRLEAEPRRAA